MVRVLSLTLALAMCLSMHKSNAFTPSAFSTRTTATSLFMALDYKDPAVTEVFNAVQPMTYEEVEEELIKAGVRGSPNMNEMDLKLMLVEVRMRSKKGDGAPKKKKPVKYSSKFEEALWEKPVFAELYEKLKEKGDHNAQNVVAEYMNNPEIAKQRYAKDYKRLLRDVEAALNAKKEVTSPSITFKGFPANMGEMGCRMTLEALGEVIDFECTQSEDFPILMGRVTFANVESAKKAIEQYDGMNMGMGSSLEIVSV